MGPDQHAQLDGFGLTLPFPIRVAALLALGWWGWGLNVQYLQKAHINIAKLIGYPDTRAPGQLSIHSATYRLSTYFTIPIVIWLIVFWVATRRIYDLVERLDWIPQSLWVVLLIILIWPLNRASRHGRIQFLLSFKRVLIGGLASDERKFGDILLADAMTSYARVFGDVYVTFCMFFTGDISATSKPIRSCGKPIVVPIIIAVPYAIRLRQCLTEYIRAQRASSQPGAGNQHLANALKYVSAFPVIYLAAKLRNYNPLDFNGYSEMSMMRILFLCSAVNSAYSFWWDVVKDWDLTLFSDARIDPSGRYAYGLRENLLLGPPRLYHYVIIADLVLRFSWAWRILPGLSWLSEKRAVCTF
ncbi:hypothetical protein N7470_009465 [Penicillium chermesinum]|nr:hypothetical protein N7470_009465 [Penicillium chermesinum]